MDNIEPCQLCGSLMTSHSYYFNFDYLLMQPFNEKQYLIKCNSCGAFQTLPLYSSQALDKYYPVQYRFAMDKKGLLSRLQKIKYENDYKFIKNQLLRRPESVFDYGAGYGEFLAFLLRKKISSGGLEPTKIARDHVLEKLGIQLSEAPAEDYRFAQKFDVVILRHVLEHVSQPTQILREIQSNGLLPGGICVIKVPNAECLERKIFGKYWAPLDIPRHRFHFTKKSLTIILNDAGFNDIQIQTERIPLDLTRTLTNAIRYIISKKANRFISPRVLNGFLFPVLTPLALTLSIFGGSRLLVVARKENE